MTKWSIRLQITLAFAVSAVCLWIAFRGVPLRAFFSALGEANYWWLLPYPLFGIALNVIRSEIWRQLLLKRAGRAEAFWAYSVGFIVNNVLPLRVGEAARITVLAARCRLPIVEVATAAGLERVLDLISVIAILAGVLPFVTNTADVRHAILWTGATTAAVILGVVVVVIGRETLDRVLRTLATAAMPRHSETILARWHELSRSLAVIAQPVMLVKVLVGAASVWGLTIVMQWFVLRAFQPAAQLVDAAVMLAMVSIASAVPAAPGALGTAQWVGRQALATPFPLRYSPTVALAAAVVSHLISYIFSTVLGAIGLWYFGLSLSSVRQRAVRERNQIPVTPPRAAESVP